ncbi:conjugal transfer protein MobA [Flavobacterium frigidarium]|uniref:conjugal transfer protein MobA n=1 Tax=Flavobacterium frigidarium TaxID=99286 RepID=UPI0030DC83D6|tara:strand:+ start:8510 stop:8953 length:444 start_codon:yes stop_codon:yes gene_type:complete
MENEEKNKRKMGGRPPKIDPAVYRFSISLTAEENARFMTLFEASGMHAMAHFITACVFQKGIKTIKIDKAAMDYYMRLTSFYSQFRAVGVNYNQVVKILYQRFSERKASACLYKLEKLTTELAMLSEKIIQLTKEFEEAHLKKENWK